ncbi:MAG: bifunctional 4-hydroxy-2-oxoglutarate aldolase/2-dehydro-3-deoxy-phosphogluconate aldolase [Limisphaerales bacterium]
MPSTPLLPGRLVCVAVVDRAEDAVPLGEALLAGGLNALEITFRTAAAAEAIRRVRAALPGMLIGAGTLLNADQLRQAMDAGAQFGVSPGFDKETVRVALAASFPFLPGVMTPTDVLRALKHGVKRLKFFPAETAGGVPMLKALAGPFAPSGVTFVPTGGINADKLAAYLALPSVEAVGGSWVAERALIKAGNWPEITRLTRAAMEVAAQVQAG